MSDWFPSKVVGKLNWFLINGDGIVNRIAESSDRRSDMDRYRNVRSSLYNSIYYNAGMETNIYYFGSRLAGISTSYSDLDFFVDVGNTYSGDSDNARAVRTLRMIKSAIQRTGIFEVKIFLPRASTPLLRVIYTRTGFECDITASNGLAVALSNIIRHLVDVQPEALKVFHYVRIWMSMVDVRMKRFIQFLLVLFYLQNQNMMPTIERVQRGLAKEFIAGWEVQYDPRRTMNNYKLSRISNYKHQVIGFFKFYSAFQFEDLVISLYSGCSMNRNRYRVPSESFIINKPLCIESPLDRSRNSAQQVGIKTLEKFREVCDHSVSFLKASGW